ncbi:hypothetical protein QAD02_022337 [Eretmocerus hayati]|uniref:Uncharacterized protein n=1 Tax=Eretmocerus hayati TaxID=131215 RepID=A0ACC2PST0_9HYME|nr:hypothetical protein QAD02_022337 [Eretmocerus hayati]
MDHLSTNTGLNRAPSIYPSLIDEVPDHPHVPKGTGKVKNLEKFDSSFFPCPTYLVPWMDPKCRTLLEHSWEAIMDAGVNPRQLMGKKVAVVVALSIAEEEIACASTALSDRSSPGLVGFSRSHYANYISFCLGFTGLSYTLDTACSSSLSALEHGFRAIRTGHCDAAIVAGVQLVTLPNLHRHFYKAGILSDDCRCKSFDEAANGFARGEASVVVFLQKAEDAKRMYATVVNARVNSDGYKEEGMSHPSSKMQAELLRDCYAECNLSPSSIKYVEAHGTGTVVGDPIEIRAIDENFCKNSQRSEPLLVGSCKSNLGHCEAASGLVSVIKVVLGMSSGVIFPNLHFKQPRKECTAIVEGRIKIVTDVTPWEDGCIGINAFGFGGSNAHVILQSNYKKKTNKPCTDTIPRLITISARTKEGVQSFFTNLKEKPFDAEYVALLHGIFSHDISGYLHRGYILLDQEMSTDDYPQMIEPFDGTKRPVCFIFSGMGSQWSGMGEALLRLPVFAESVQKCDAVMKPYGVDVYELLTVAEEAKFDQILNSFVAITVIQICLVDVLNTLNIKPNYVVGHSAGESVCAYANGCLNLEQTLLSAYYRGQVSIEIELIHGTMAAVGLGYNDLKNMCPPDIVVGCHNSATSSTISGPTASVEVFMAELEARNIFVKKVRTGNIASHSQYVEPSCPRFQSLLEGIIPNPLPRGESWLSTSIPKEEWNNPSAQLASAEYFTNNLRNPVLFEEILDMIPKDAITIEIAPRGLLQAILKRALPPTVSNCTLTTQDREGNLNFFLESIGQLFNLGLQPDLAKIYPKVEFPVSCGTQSISPLIKWEHSADWLVSTYDFLGMSSAGEQYSILSPEIYPKDSSLTGHVVDGLNLFPATGYIELVWSVFSIMNGKCHTKFPVLFEDLQFSRATIVPKQGAVVFRININIGSGRFEVSEGQTTVASGFVYHSSHAEAIRPDIKFDDDDSEEILKTDDIYTQLKIAGCDYSGSFRSIVSCNYTGSKGHIAWKDDWVAFLDNMLQTSVIGLHSNQLFVPIGIDRVFIDPEYHMNAIETSSRNKEISVHVDKVEKTIISGGVDIRGVRVASINRRKLARMPIIEEYTYVPFMDEKDMHFASTLRIICQIVCENHDNKRVTITELVRETDELSTTDMMSPVLFEAFENTPAYTVDISIVTSNDKYKDDPSLGSFQLISPNEMGTLSNLSVAIGHRLLEEDSESDLNSFISKLKPQGFLLSCETRDIEELKLSARAKDLSVILIRRFEDKIFILLRKQNPTTDQNISVIRVTNQNFDWIEHVRNAMKEVSEKDNASSYKIILVGQGEIDNGLMGLVKCLRQEPGGEVIRGVSIQDLAAEEFSLHNPFYADHMTKDLVLSVLRKNGSWGTYAYFPIVESIYEEHNHAIAQQLVPADLSSIKWVEGPIKEDSQVMKSENLIRIVYAALNFRDVMFSTGKLGAGSIIQNGKVFQPFIGVEFSGYNAAGEKFAGYSHSSSFTNLYESNPECTFKIPSHWTLEDGATVFVAYATAYYALFVRGNIKKGDRVLIHSGSGAVGQAAIRLALHEECEVFTTVGTPEKRKFIMDNFPQIKDDHIGNSRDTSFRRMVMEQTNGNGVDIVLNSLSEEKLKASFKCLALGGRFLEIGKYDIEKNSYLGMNGFQKDTSFHGVMLDYFLVFTGKKHPEIIQYILKGIESGAVQPLVRTVFDKDNVAEALKYMTSGKHIGKVLVKVQEEDYSTEYKIKALPRYHCTEDRSYLVLGGLGGFGLELVDWLVSRGAKTVVISSRSGVKNGYQESKIRKWNELSVRVLVISGKDASKFEDCEFILDAATQLAPVDGIFNLGVVLKDALWENQTAEQFEEVFRCKVNATNNLDTLSRTKCPLLRKFVVFSSAACGRGNAGQTNYGMANAVMERICERRASEGLPALAIQWGPVGDVGLVSQDASRGAKTAEILGYAIQGIASCLQELDKLLPLDRTTLSCMILAEKHSVASSSCSAVETVMKIMGLKTLTGISPNTPLAELGLDSMSAVEIKQTLEREHGVFLTVKDLRTLSFDKLQKMSTDGSSKNGHPIASDSPTDGDDMLSVMIMRDQFLGSDTTDPNVCYELRRLTAKTEKEIFLAPGTAGFASILQTLSSKLKASATGLQLGFETAEIPIGDMASRFVQDIYNRCESKKKFVIVGYSFGSLIALEVTRRLEQMGLQGSLIFIDGSPEYVKCSILSSLNTEGPVDQALQDTILLRRTALLDPEDHDKLAKALEQSKEWEDKLQTFFDMFPETVHGVSIEFQRGMVQSLYPRFMAALNYNIPSDGKIKAPIVLLKSTKSSIHVDREDFNIPEITTGETRVIEIEADHLTILANQKTADVINEVAENFL